MILYYCASVRLMCACDCICRTCILDYALHVHCTCQIYSTYNLIHTVWVKANPVFVECKKRYLPDSCHYWVYKEALKLRSLNDLLLQYFKVTTCTRLPYLDILGAPMGIKYSTPNVTRASHEHPDC